MKVTQFSHQCAATCSSRLPDAKGFDFTIFIPLVLEFLVETLSNCGRDDDDIVEAIQKPDFWTTYAVRSSVKKAAKAEGVIVAGSLRTVADTILDEAQKAGPAGVKAMLQETRSNVPDFHSVWG